nr:hypothetical protein [Rhizobium sp. P40RR-XXII]
MNAFCVDASAVCAPTFSDRTRARRTPDWSVTAADTLSPSTAHSTTAISAMLSASLALRLTFCTVSWASKGLAASAPMAAVGKKVFMVAISSDVDR